MLTHPVLHQLAASGVKLGVDRVKRFLTHLGEPHLAYPVVHVAGTNGKGSVCAMVTACLVEAGLRVGTYVSPHLEAVNERVQIDGVPIYDGDLSDAIDRLDRERWDWVQLNEESSSVLTYYEFMTILAFRYFAQAGVDVAVIEVGLGGRLDATNVVSPLVTAITTISMDHQQELGDSLDKIAVEKAGIIKTGVPLVMGVIPEIARKPIEQIASARTAEMWRPGPQMTKEKRRGVWNFRTPGGTVSGVALQMEGEHQGTNALVAIGVIHRLRAAGFLITDGQIAKGLSGVRLGGRIERVLPGLVVDGAHNEDSVKALVKWLKGQERPKNRILLWGMGKGRDPVRLLQPLTELVDEVVTTCCAHPKAINPMELALILQDNIDVPLSEGGEIDEVLQEIYREADETIVAGSLYLAGAVRSLVRVGTLDGVTPGQGPEEEAEEEESGDDDGE